MKWRELAAHMAARDDEFLNTECSVLVDEDGIHKEATVTELANGGLKVKVRSYTMNQFEAKLGQVSYRSVNDDENSFKSFVEETLGYPVPVVPAGYRVGRLAGWDEDEGNDRYDRLFAVKVVNQDVADLLNYLSNSDDGQAVPDTTILVFIPEGCTEYTLPDDCEIILMSRAKWNDNMKDTLDRRKEATKNARKKMEDAIMVASNLPNMTPFEEEDTI